MLFGIFAISISRGQVVETQVETNSDSLFKVYRDEIRPLIIRYCVECHSAENPEAEIDLVSIIAESEIRTRSEVWQQVNEVLSFEQMPPAESPQPSDAERERLGKWVRNWLTNEARSLAGDPGPVILRRLSNAEYNYTIQELTEVDKFDPAAEFPVDGAAGEGFTNTGSAQGMSPALVTKYLDAAKDIAGHAVLLPDGIRFSRFDSRRDQSDELLAKIQAFYRRYTDEGGGTAVDLQGIRLETNQGGLLPIEKYLRATLEFRDDLHNGLTTIRQVAATRGLSAAYLDRLWQALNDQSAESESLLLMELQASWRVATIKDVLVMTDTIRRMQQALWRFNSVGQIGRAGGPTAWMEPVSPIVSSIALRLPLSAEEGKDTVFHLSPTQIDGGDRPDMIELQRPRLEFSDHRPPIMLKSLELLVPKVEATLASETQRTAEYLDAIKSIRETDESVEVVARTKNLDPQLLVAWADYLALGPKSREVSGHLTEPLAHVNGNEAISGWGSPETPSLLTNRSEEPVVFSTLTLPPRSVFVHPSPTMESVVVWKSLFDGQIKVNGLVADADGTCGNGIQWTIQLQNERELAVIEQGTVENADRQEIALANGIDVRVGDLISLVVSARDQSHVCDTTKVDMTVSEIGGDQRIWNLANDIVDQVQDGNPLGDSYGNMKTWHFCARAVANQSMPVIPADSMLNVWRNAVIDSRPPDELGQLAVSVQQLLTASTDERFQPSDRELRRQLLFWDGPLRWLAGIESGTPPSESASGTELRLFDTTMVGPKFDGENLLFPATQSVEIRLPWQLADGADFVTDGFLLSEKSQEGHTVGNGIQLNALNSKPKSPVIDWAAPFICSDGPAREQLERAMQEIRDLFPAALCYTRIVPVDEVVTLTLYHRDDAQLKRLMLTAEEIAELDRLWDQLYFVSQEPISLTTVFEQISEFATQDRPDLVEAFAPMRKPIFDRADEFRARLRQVEPVHLHAAQEFAAQAWRRPLSDDEVQGLAKLYQELRDSELPHDKAIRLILARVLVSPALLFKLEETGSGIKPEPISDFELASRLSYFLWSSPPDKELRAIAESGMLAELKREDASPNSTTSSNPEHAVLLEQTRRLLVDPRTRRLAIQFACQWLHVRDFDKNNDKNENVFPEFPTLRNDMYEETVLFFADLFRNDGSILDFVDADHTFVNETLARHYGIENVTGSEWQRVNGMQDRGRGGVLGMATILASQSGASRTSPILRGNWVSETLLGERLPRPPPNVPQLPETLPDGLTARQLIELHSSQAGCAKCHSRMDPYGFALEQFDAIGRLRPEESDTKTRLADGTPIEGIAGVIDYLSTARRDDVIRNFCRKLLGYSLGREVLLSDEPLLDEMQLRLRQNEYRFSIAVETIVTSPQFLRIRGRSFDPPAD